MGSAMGLRQTLEVPEVPGAGTWRLYMRGTLSKTKDGTQELVICRCFSLSRGPFSGSMFVFRGVAPKNGGFQ